MGERKSGGRGEYPLPLLCAIGKARWIFYLLTIEGIILEKCLKLTLNHGNVFRIFGNDHVGVGRCGPGSTGTNAISHTASRI